jgi:hypothetical protein
MTKGLRFRRSIGLGKGLHMNVSKSGVSWSVGGKGLSFNLSKRGVTRTVGLPGTGINYRKKLGTTDRHEIVSSPPAGGGRRPGLPIWAVILIIIAAMVVWGQMLNLIVHLLPKH